MFDELDQIDLFNMNNGVFLTKWLSKEDVDKAIGDVIHINNNVFKDTEQACSSFEKFKDIIQYAYKKF